MALTINNPIGGGALSNKYTTTTTTTTTGTAFQPRLSILHHRHQSLLSVSSRRKTSTLIVSATGKFTSRTGKFDSKNRRSSTTTTKEEAAAADGKKVLIKNYEEDGVGVIDGSSSSSVDDGYFLPELPGDKPDFWEGPQWDALGFFVQYMWAFGVVFSLVACGIAVATYNEGATDFRETPAYKEAIQSKDLLEGPEGSDTDVFESNPTEEAPALE